jgi:mRNA interferase MazF
VPYRRDADLDAGDLVWVDFGPPFGHEQAGRRPALVISPRSYNEQSSLIMVCPITRSRKPWPFKVEFGDEKQGIRGAILVDQLRSVDRTARFTRRVDRAQLETIDQVYGVLAALLGIPVPN